MIEIHRFSRRAMACEFGIAIRGADSTYSRQAADAAFLEVERIERELSRFNPASDVSRINELSPGRWLTVGPDTAACLKIASRAFRQSRGAFDPAFLSPGGSKTGRRFQQLVIDTHLPRVRVTAPVMLDLGGIGKGYAVDRIAGVLREWGILDALIHAGTSSVRAVGGPWPVALRHPGLTGRSVGRLALTDAALGASAQRLNGLHITDPRTGRPPARAGVWALCASAAVADALSTAALILPAGGIRSLCRRVVRLSVMIAAGGGIRLSCRRFGVRSVFGSVTGGARR